MGKLPVLKEMDLWLWMEVLMHRAIRERRMGLSHLEVFIAIKIGNCKRVRGKRVRGKRVRGKISAPLRLCAKIYFGWL